MKFSDLFKLSTRMFKARTSRTLLTILGMSIGIGAILFLVSLGYGLQKTLLEKITTSDSLLTLDVTESKSGAVVLDKNLVEQIEKTDGVSEVSPAFQMNAQGKIEDLVADVVVFGSKPSFLKLGGVRMDTGETLTDENPKGVVITSSVGQIFGKSSDELLGGEINLSFLVPEEGTDELQSSFKIVEMTEPYEVIGIVPGDENVVYVNSQSTESLNISRFSQLKVKCDNNEIMTTVRDKILERGFLVSSLSETVDQANKIFRVVQIVLMLFGIIALVVSAIGMFNTMTIALLERTEEIGIMKSIGASDFAISLMFIMEATVMGFLGGLAGVLIGVVEGKALNFLINFVASRFGGESVNLFFSPSWFVLLIIAFAALVGLITGVIPARRASRIDPLDALRYK